MILTAFIVFKYEKNKAVKGVHDNTYHSLELLHPIGAMILCVQNKEHDCFCTA